MEIVTYQDKAIQSYNDIENVAKAMVSSGYFTDSTKISQAIVKIMAGREIGVGPFGSMNGIHIIQGKPAFGANIMAGKVKSSGRYNYRVTEMTDEVCTIEFLEFFNFAWTTIGVSSFNITDAKKAGTKNLDKFPRNMLFARAMSNGVRWYCPDVMNGSVVYTPEELGADVDEDGNVVNVHFVESTPVNIPEPEPEVIEAKPEPQANDDIMTIERASKVTNSEGTPYVDIPSDTLQKMVIGINKGLKNGIDDEKRAEYLEKKQAIGVILKARANKEI